jgi:malate dehydrogenase
MRPKITVIGAGDTGTTTAHRLLERGYADVVLLDRLAREKARDLAAAAALSGYEPRLSGTDDYEDTAGSNVVVITAMSDDVAEEVKDRSPDAIVISANGSSSLMCSSILEATKFARGRVLGISPLLGAARFRALVARDLCVSVRDVSALVVGGSGDEMVPVLSHARVAGIPLRRLIGAPRLAEIVTDSRRGGEDAPFATSAAVREVVDAVVLDRRRVIPCTALCDGEYGLERVCVGVPVKVGARGVEEIVELELDDREREQLERSVQALRT